MKISRITYFNIGNSSEEGEDFFDGRRIWNDNYLESDSVLMTSRSHSQILGVQLPESEVTYLILKKFQKIPTSLTNIRVIRSLQQLDYSFPQTQARLKLRLIQLLQTEC